MACGAKQQAAALAPAAVGRAGKRDAGGKVKWRHQALQRTPGREPLRFRQPGHGQQMPRHLGLEDFDGGVFELGLF